MKNLSYAQFMSEVETIISNLSEKGLKNRIMNFAEVQTAPERNNFLKVLKNELSTNICSDKEKANPQISPEKLIERIKNFEQRILGGEFFDEEENWKAMDKEEHSYWNKYDDYNDEIDFSNKPYVLEAIELLEETKGFFRKNDIETAFEAYGMLFDIFEHPDNYEEECFVYGFSFKDAIDTEIYNEHKTIYLRCLYLDLAKKNNLNAIYTFLANEEEILLSDIIEIARSPLPRLNEVSHGLIEYLKSNAKYDKLLIDILFIKGGMEEVKKFAYANGKNHPAVFLYYYYYAKEKELPQSDLLQLILDGIKIIPQKYQTRSLLSLDLIETAKKTNDKKDIALGYSTAFYSDPTLRNLTYFLDFLALEYKENQHIELREYLSEKDIKKSDPYGVIYFNRHHNLSEDIYSLNSSKIDSQTLIIGRYILEEPQTLLDLVKPKDYLGFSDSPKYIAVIVSLILKSISQSRDAVVIDLLVDYYCCDTTNEERIILKKLISNKANSLPDPQTYLIKPLGTIEKLSVNRVTHILENKLRGGYESACLLLVACAEAKQILTNNGNEFIQHIDNQFKRFVAFRKYLKDLTSMSKYLISVR